MSRQHTFEMSLSSDVPLADRPASSTPVVRTGKGWRWHYSAVAEQRLAEKLMARTLEEVPMLLV